MIPFYKIHITGEDDGMDFIALVDVPAHMKAFEYFGKDNKKPVKMFFNEERRIVTGVAIATDLPIYRNSPDIGEHYVVFTKEETLKIAKRMMQNGFFHNVNEMHDANKKVEGVYLVESYFIDRSRGVNEPESFKNQNLKDGTWITSYYVENDQVWNDIKKGKFFGFSIEGWFDKTPINIKQTKKEKQMSEKKKLLERVLEVFATDKQEAKASEVFGEAMTVDGVSVVWDGEELNEGIELRVVTEEGEVLAPDGEHAIDVDGVIFVITTEGGVITNIAEEAPAEEEMENQDVTSDEVIIEFSKIMQSEFKKAKEESNKEIETLKETIKELNEKFNALVNGTEETKRKFNKTTTESKSEAKGWKELIKRQ